jgi:hypothetical protein
MKTTSMALAALWLSSLTALCQANRTDLPAVQTAHASLTAEVKPEIKKVNPAHLKFNRIDRAVRDVQGNSSKTAGIDNSNAVAEIKAFPNPFTTQIDVIITDGHMAQASYKANLYDVNGKKVHAENLTANQSTLQLGHLSAGVYFLYVEKNGTIMKQEKFVKQ